MKKFLVLSALIAVAATPSFADTVAQWTFESNTTGNYLPGTGTSTSNYLAEGGSQAGIAAATGLHRNTITNIEVGRYGGDHETLKIIKRVLEQHGIVFIDANGGGPGVRFRKPPPD